MEGWTEEEIQNRNLRVIKRAIPKWREKVATQGDEKGSLEWAREECERYHCSSCGSPLYLVQIDLLQKSVFFHMKFTNVGGL